AHTAPKAPPGGRIVCFTACTAARADIFIVPFSLCCGNACAMFFNVLLLPVSSLPGKKRSCLLCCEALPRAFLASALRLCYDNEYLIPKQLSEMGAYYDITKIAPLARFSAGGPIPRAH
ncbi:hypothetical protein, partial [uncultured Ruthenibacterium sp.]|uniref:hypothetical protein n=1 Tax=uncultured Ruthenibacterium sp. TaxID=1905347 RepID=UPI0025978DD8